MQIKEDENNIFLTKKESLRKVPIPDKKLIELNKKSVFSKPIQVSQAPTTNPSTPERERMRKWLTYLCEICKNKKDLINLSLPQYNKCDTLVSGEEELPTLPENYKLF